MSEPAAVQVVPAESVAAQTVANETATRQKRNADLTAKFVQQAKETLATDATQGTPETPAPGQADPDPSPAAPERGPDGKFASKAKPKTEPDAPSQTEPAGKVEPEDLREPNASQLAKARALLDEGKPVEAFRAAFGKDPSEVKIGSKEWEAWRHQTTKAKRELAAKEQELRSEASRVVQAYQPMVDAAEAWKRGDVEGFIKGATGLSVTDFQSLVLKGVVNKDPRIQALEKQLAEQGAAIRQWREQEAKDRAAAQQQAAIAEFKASLGETLAEVPGLAKHAARSAFIDEVYEVLDEHAVSSTESSLSPEEAAALVLQRARDRYGFDEASAPPGGDRGAFHARKGPAPSAAKPGRTTRSTTIDPTATTEATGPRKIEDKQKLMEHYIALHKSAQLAANR